MFLSFQYYYGSVLKTKNNLKNFIFFLGGSDLEMQTIKEILDENKLDYFDKNLSWGAKLSEYENELKNLEKNKTPVLIELTLDIDPPENAKIIDHHNKKENEPSSLEQIVNYLNKELNLKIELNRWQQLVAANDSGYIPAMECLCATKEEIKKIRKADRKAQGVTEEDEKLAEQSIAENKTVENEITVIKSLTEMFSPIVDKMYGKADKLLIYTDTSLTYYGKGKKQIAEKFTKEINEKKAYHGGGNSGYFGLIKGKFTKDEIINIKNKIVKMNIEDNSFFSHHIFIFPFKWKLWQVDNNASFNERNNIYYFYKEVTKEDHWERKEFNLDLPDKFNEYNYFYEYVREILYDLSKELKIDKTKGNDKLINHFEYNLPKDKKVYYNIKLFCDKGTVYSLEIDSILLNVYATGTAVLSFHLRNHLYENKEDILKINKFGRRLYVPFFDLEAESIYTSKGDKTPNEKLLCSTKKNEIPDAIWIGDKTLISGDENKFEDFKKYKEKENYKNGPFLLPKFIEDLFPPKFFLVHENQGYTNSDKNKKNTDYKIYLRPVLDSRMHIVSWYGNTYLVNKLKKTKNHFAYSFENNDWWYSYIFADAPDPMCQDKFLKAQLVKQSTYTRWIGLGTLFGASRYSFAMLTSSFQDLEVNGATYLVRHLQTMYYKMVELSLLQRATVLSFQGEITDISNLNNPFETKDKKNKDKETTKRITELYKYYLVFLNKIYFKEITTQEQGIEIYDLMQKQMRIANDVKNLDNEIEELHKLATHLEEKKQTKEAHKLTQLATLLAVPAIFIELFGTNIFPDNVNIPEYFFGGKFSIKFLVGLIFIAILSFLGIKLINFWINKSTKNE